MSQSAQDRGFETTREFSDDEELTGVRSVRALRPTSQGKIVGTDPQLVRVLDTIDRVSRASCNVLITGESGTGKELVVAALHDASARREGPLVAVNCGAIPTELVEAELFGHTKGAFTGAQVARRGFVAAAEGGTLFLDEVGELPLSVQVKLLRILQAREYTPLGESRPVRCDVRVVAATNRDLAAEVAAGRFREDLYYRLNVIRLHLPPLRERRDDIALLARHFTALHARRNRRTIAGIAPDAMDALSAWGWPGNVRELENAIERAVVLARGELLGLADLPPAMRQQRPAPNTLSFAVGTPLKIIEREMIEATLQLAGGDKARAAALLGITSRTIYRREADWREEEAD